MPKLNLRDFDSPTPKVKYAATKNAIELSIKNPEEVYPHLDYFKNLLKSENNIFKWTAITVIGNLSLIDKENKVDPLIPELIKLSHDPRMITAANSINALGLIAKNKPQYKQEILQALFEVEHTDFYNKGELSPECRNIAIGDVLKAFQRLGEETINMKEVQDFIKRQTQNTRHSVKVLAEKLLRQ